MTGGAGGIGKAAAALFLKEGAKVVLWDLDVQRLDAACAELSGLGDVKGYALDITDPRQVSETALKVEKDLGPVDVLDNNAGVVFGAPFLAGTAKDDEKTLGVNVLALMWCTRAFLPGMIARKRGHLVMMASAAGMMGVPGMAAYSASKHAVIGFSESLRLELRRERATGVGMSIVCPSFVSSGMFAGVKPPLLTPWLTPEFVAARVVDAVKRDKLYVREPFVVKAVPLLKGIAGSAFVDRLGEIFGASEAMKGWKGRS